MRRLLATAFATVLGLTCGAAAQETQSSVVVELYTSQGCSSCPAADALLTQLAARDDIIALALHVDYWDYIGWKDSFGNPAFTRRQKGYAHAARARTIYTPQMVIDGQYHVVGNRADEVARSIAMRQAKPDPVAISLSRGADGVTVSLRALVPQAMDCVIQFVRYLPEASVTIERGENAGQTLLYSNIVTEWDVVAEWDGRDTWTRTFRLAPDERGVIIVQAEEHGPILAAAQLH